MKTLPNRVLAILTAFICILFTIFVVGVFAPRRERLWEFIVPVNFLSFLSLLYFIPILYSRKKAAIFCLAIPFLCTLTIYITSDFMPHILDFKVLNNTASYILHSAIMYCVVGVYSCIISILLMLIRELHFYLSRHVGPYIKSEHILGESHLLFLLAIIVYVIYTPGFYLIFKNHLADGSVLLSSVAICILSLFSMLFIIPIFIGKTIKIIGLCLLIPFFWSLSIYLTYAMLTFVFIWNTAIWDNWGPYFGRDVFSIGFCLRGYFKTHAWFSSFPLIVLYLVYCYVLKLKHPKQAPEDSIVNSGRGGRKTAQEYLKDNTSDPRRTGEPRKE